MNTNLKMSNRPVIHLDITQRADLLVLPSDGQIKRDEASADFGSATENCRGDHGHSHSMRHSARHDHTSRTRRNWLLGDPFAWRGRKIRHRKTRAIYTVRQVFLKSSRVELQKGMMSYQTHIITIRKDYETYS